MTSTLHLLASLQIIMAEGTRTVPGPEASVNEKLLFLRENMVHLTNQLSMPIIEVALVISKYIRIVLDSLQKAAIEEGEELPEVLLNPVPNDSESTTETVSGIDSFPLEKLIGRIDQDRIDIFDTLVRTILNESQLEFVSALREFRDWEFEIRNQLSEVSSPGGLFSPLSLDDEF